MMVLLVLQNTYANWEDNVQTGNIILVAPTPASALTVQINYIKDPPNLHLQIIPIFLNIKSLCYYMEY